MTTIRVLRGPVSAIKRLYGGLFWSGVAFRVGDPPELVTIAGTAFLPLAEGEYMAVAVKHGIFSDRGEVVLAYRALGQRGDAHESGRQWVSYMVIPSAFALLVCCRVMLDGHRYTEAAIWFAIAAVFGLAAVYRMRVVKEAVRQLGSCQSI